MPSALRGHNVRRSRAQAEGTLDDMPLVRISLLKGRNEAHKHAMCEAAY